MDIIRPIDPMLSDEHVLAVSPSNGTSAVRKHLNAFQGRALSARDLSDLQKSRMAHQSLLHRSVSSGIVSGLDIAWLQSTNFTLSPGFGLTASGEDIFIGTPKHFSLVDLPILIPQANGTSAAVEKFAAMSSNQGAIASHAAVLLAVPISHLSNDQVPAAADEFVARDPVDDPFAGTTETDGCVLALFPVSASTLLGQGKTFDPAKASFRNDLAQAIFVSERRSEFGIFHPWQEEGLPLALFGFNADWSVQFVDRASVVRSGGLKIARSVIPKIGDASLWKAQIEQFGEQLGSMETLPNQLASLQQTFPKLPPVGFLPRRLAAFGEPDSLFPANFNLLALPVPDDQVSTIFRECCALDAIDLSKGETIELAFPVPVADYDPLLLWTEAISDEFDITVDSFRELRDGGLRSNAVVQSAREALAYAMRGDFEFQIKDHAMIDDEWAATFAARRVAELSSGSIYTFNAPRTHNLLVRDESFYIWVWLDKNVKSFKFSAAAHSVKDQAVDAKVLNFTWSQPVKDDAEPPEVITEIPKTENWVRLIVPGFSFLAELEAEAAEIVGFGLQVWGGSARVAEMGIMDASGNLKPILSDVLPEAGFPNLPKSDNIKWSWVEPETKVLEDGFGTALSGDLRGIPILDDFLSKLKGQSFLGDEGPRLATLPLAQLIDELTRQINTTNDVIDLGFLKARANTFRVREFMLGSDAASRVVDLSCFGGCCQTGYQRQSYRRAAENFS
jgi:hypothetical protein